MSTQTRRDLTVPNDDNLTGDLDCARGKARLQIDRAEFKLLSL
jgi:hypothetical protein